ncbi:MAG: hypothetical protein F4X57_06360 [Chloroflexi bacterium]|nr:hypothetical protein [Chloroflexota bacterium]
MNSTRQSYAIRIIDSLQADIDNPRFWRRRHPRLQRRFRLVLDMLSTDPYAAARSERLRHDFSGLRSAVLVNQWRLIFNVYEECRRDGFQDNNPIDCCRNEVDTLVNTVNVIEISDHYA